MQEVQSVKFLCKSATIHKTNKGTIYNCGNAANQFFSMTTELKRTKVWSLTNAGTSFNLFIHPTHRLPFFSNGMGRQ